MTPPEHPATPATGNIAWASWREGAAGRPLVLLHATGFHRHLWDAVVERLGHDGPVFAADTPGHGASPGSDNRDWIATARAMLPWFDHVTADAAPALVAGHSFGGFVAMLFAAERPGRVARLVMIDPVIPPRFTAEQLAAVDPSAFFTARRRNAFDSAEGFVDAYASRDPYAGWEPRALRDYAAHGLVPADGGFKLACDPLTETSAYLGGVTEELAPYMAAVRAPVTVVRGRAGERGQPLDFSVSPTPPDLAARFADGRDLHWSDHTHFIPMEAPGRIAALLDQELAA